MAAVIEEAVDSGSTQDGDSRSVELIYYVLDPTGAEVSRATAMALASATLPEETDGLPLTTMSVRPDGSWFKWIVSATYGTPGANAGEYPQDDFDTTGGTQKLFQSLGTTTYPAIAGVDPPDHRGLIGVTDDSVDGVDVVVPVYKWSETHRMLAPSKATLMALTGKTNNAPFKGFAQGELLFLGATGRRASNSLYEVRFSFAAAPNRTGVTIGEVEGVSAYGWDYVWSRYKQVPVDGKLETVQLAVYVSNVYAAADFSLLGI